MMQNRKTDILSRTEIVQLINLFYERVKTDPQIGVVFAHVDWEKHLPVMYNFWGSILLGEQSYRGNPLQAHLSLPLGKVHFAQWLKLFTETVDEHFAGEKTEEIKQRAQSIAGVFQHKLGLNDKD